MSADLLLTFNAGSSTVKIGLFETDASGARRVARGVIDFRKPPLSLHITEGPSTFKVVLEAEASDDLRPVMEETFAWLAQHFDISRLTAAGHRVVHGGAAFAGPVRFHDQAINA